jgi:GT2 family glycosyltransferase/glycosyltransferase involved in cell wall biosynthesis
VSDLPVPSPRREALRRAAHRAAPPGSTSRAGLRLGRQLARDGVGYLPRLRALWALATQAAPREPSYVEWWAQHRAHAGDLLHQLERHAEQPLDVDIEIVVLPGADGGSTAAVGATVRSLEAQSVQRWRATVLAPDGWKVPSDPRVHRVPTRPTDAADALVARLAEGDPASLVLVLEAGDLAEPDLLHHVASHAWDDPEADLFHWDDDLLDAEGVTSSPLFRPSWSPDTLLGTNYLGRSFALRRRAVRRGGLPAPDLGDAMWWDLVLRAGLTADLVVRVPRVLTHVRRRPAPDPDRSVRVVAEHLDRAGLDAEARADVGGVRVRWALPAPPHVTVVVPTRHNREMLERCLPSLARTDYPSFDVRVVDNGGRSTEREAWYDQFRDLLDLDVRWWDEPFNYSRVNNVTARDARGEVLVFLNDDTDMVDPGWMREMVSWAVSPGIGLVGLKLLDAEGLIQHGGVVVGVNGFADHLFAGMPAHAETIFGGTDWYRDLLSVTAACVAVRRELFEQVGGFDERFVLCGSDVVLGFDTTFAGCRNVLTPYSEVRHLESVTRGTSVPIGDFHASYWRYQKYLRGGDPYFSPNLSTRSGVPALRGADDKGPMAQVGSVLGRNFTVFRQRADESEATWLADICRADDEVVDAVELLHARTVGRADVQTINWFFPDIDSPFYGGINTALRMAEHLARDHGVQHRFVIMANPNEAFFRSALEAAFPSLADVPMSFVGSPLDPALDDVPYADVAIATLWVTAYSVARFPNARRKFYLIQDFEPQFYPAGTNYALSEEGYRLGLYGLCNTERLLDIYRRDYRGVGGAFMPAVDDRVFHARGRRPRRHEGPVTVFVYARPGHWRNCWELASLSLAQLKESLGDDVRIVTAGSWARPDDLGRGIEHLGLLDYRDTGELYRRADVGVALTVSAHPSYLPLELMACGVPVVAFDNPAGDWILEHEVNSLRCRRTVDGLAGALERLALDPELRDRLGAAAEATIADRFSNWDAAFAPVHGILSDPEGA